MKTKLSGNIRGFVISAILEATAAREWLRNRLLRKESGVPGHFTGMNGAHKWSLPPGGR